jgi:TonB family protein
MAHRLIIFLLALLTVAASAAPAQESDTSQHARKVARMVTPVYPDLARRLQMSGVVKLTATVAPDGSVKSIKPLGGHPLFVKAAQDAVTIWKFVPAQEESQELVELHFKPQ